MKLMKLEEFIKLPAGTIYKKNSGGGLLEIKGGWVSDDGNDWSSDLFAADCKDDQDTHIAMLYGESFPIQTDRYGRDGCFDADEYFYVYESWDLEQLRLILDRAISVALPQKFKQP